MESNSISNQRGTLEKYVKIHLDTTGYEVRRFVDDGFTGISMERPAMHIFDMIDPGHSKHLLFLL